MQYLESIYCLLKLKIDVSSTSNYIWAASTFPYVRSGQFPFLADSSRTMFTFPTVHIS